MIIQTVLFLVGIAIFYASIRSEFWGISIWKPGIIIGAVMMVAAFILILFGGIP